MEVTGRLWRRSMSMTFQTGQDEIALSLISHDKLACISGQESFALVRNYVRSLSLRKLSPEQEILPLDVGMDAGGGHETGCRTSPPAPPNPRSRSLALPKKLPEKFPLRKSPTFRMFRMKSELSPINNYVSNVAEFSSFQQRFLRFNVENTFTQPFHCVEKWVTLLHLKRSHL